MTDRTAAPGEARTRAIPISRPDACDVCGGPTYERHCKIICLRCGYTRDCSDP